jgi:hypothetical protein
MTRVFSEPGIVQALAGWFVAWAYPGQAHQYLPWPGVPGQARYAGLGLAGSRAETGARSGGTGPNHRTESGRGEGQADSLPYTQYGRRDSEIAGVILMDHQRGFQW